MDLTERLEDAKTRRTDLAAKKQRLQGKLDSAESQLKTVEDEIRAKNITPEQLPEARQKLETRYEELVTQIEQDVAAGEEAIAPFVKEG